MQRAFHEATRASWLFTAPNPRVGALALKDGHVVGYGYHAAFGAAHAEEQALRDAGALQQDGARMQTGCVDEIFVTLEPCSSKGPGKKRSACVEMLLQAGVRRVVLGATDPDVRHQGAAFQILRDAGVTVEILQMDAEFRAQNPGFLAALTHPQRPWVLLKWAASLDGRTATSGGSSQWITGPIARQEVHRLRALSHGVVAGKGTVVGDQPRLTAREGDGAPSTATARILVGALQSVAAQHPLLTDSVSRFWIEADSSAAAQPSWWGPQDTLVGVQAQRSGRVDLAEALACLREQHGMQRLLIEGGSHLHAALLEAGLADAVVRYEAPLLLHGGLAALEGVGVEHPSHGQVLDHEERKDLGLDLRRAFLLTAGA